MVVFVRKGMLLEFTSQWACAHSLTFNSFQPHGLQAACQALCPETFPGKHTGMGCHSLLQGIFPTQWPNSAS